MKHNLPEKCLEESFDTKKDSNHNSTHMLITTVISKECHKYNSILEDCKSECVDEEESPKKGRVLSDQ